MSVPAYRRNESHLKVLNLAMDVFDEAMRLVKKEQLVAKKNLRFVGEPFIQHLRELIYKIALANNLHTNDLDELHKRLKIQNDAKLTIVVLMADIQMLMRLTSNSKMLGQYCNVIQLMDKLKGSLNNWMKHSKDLINNFSNVEQI